MKKAIVLATALLCGGCKMLDDVNLGQLGNLGNLGLESVIGVPLSQDDIANGLRQALNNGIEHQVKKLTSPDGFYRNELVKILLPKELQFVDKTLRSVGLGSLADKGLRAINNSAEKAVKTATPIFVNAVKNMTFSDVKNILLGEENAATVYLQNQTQSKLYQQFNPVIKQSFKQVGADKIWKDIIKQYNQLPFVKRVNPDLTDYVTTQALNGVFKMIGEEEKGIRNNVGLRNTKLLRQVFALQDGKK